MEVYSAKRFSHSYNNINGDGSIFFLSARKIEPSSFMHLPREGRLLFFLALQAFMEKFPKAAKATGSTLHGFSRLGNIRLLFLRQSFK